MFRTYTYYQELNIMLLSTYIHTRIIVTLRKLSSNFRENLNSDIRSGKLFNLTLYSHILYPQQFKRGN